MKVGKLRNSSKETKDTQANKRKRRGPRGWACQAGPNCPRTIWEKLVVSPQAGQKTPVQNLSGQGGKPRARCVPIPAGSGVRRMAISITGMKRAAGKSQRDRDIPVICGRGSVSVQSFFGDPESGVAVDLSGYFIYQPSQRKFHEKSIFFVFGRYGGLAGRRPER